MSQNKIGLTTVYGQNDNGGGGKGSMYTTDVISRGNPLDPSFATPVVFATSYNDAQQESRGSEPMLVRVRSNSSAQLRIDAVDSPVMFASNGDILANFVFTNNSSLLTNNAKRLAIKGFTIEIPPNINANNDTLSWILGSTGTTI